MRGTYEQGRTEEDDVGMVREGQRSKHEKRAGQGNEAVLLYGKGKSKRFGGNLG